MQALVSAAEGEGGRVRRDGGRLAARSVALDVFRGMCVAGMILVTDPGTYTAVYPQLLHAAWHGATAADMIFPGFLFAVGVALLLALRARLEREEAHSRVLLGALRRAVLLVAAGLILNGYPDFAMGRLRLPGVLQRIGLCYLAAAAIWLPMAGWSERRRRLGLGGTMAVLLLGYAAALLLVPVPGFGPGHLDTLRSLPASVDRALFTTAHLWPYGLTPGVGVTFDPEGSLSTIPAIASVLFGVVTGEVLLVDRSRRSPGEQRRVLARTVLLAIVLIGTGLACDPVMPIIKKLWTPSFALLSSGVSLLGFLLCSWFIDLQGMRRGTTAARIFGTNALPAFAVSGLLTSTLDLLQRDGMSWHTWGYRHLFLPWMSPVHASLLYAICIVAVNCALMGPLYRRRIFLKL